MGNCSIDLISINSFNYDYFLGGILPAYKSVIQELMVGKAI